MARTTRSVFALSALALAMAGCLQSEPSNGTPKGDTPTADVDASTGDAKADATGEDGTAEDTPTADMTEPDAKDDVTTVDIVEDFAVLDTGWDASDEDVDPCSDWGYCDDNDICTDDFCDAAGECQHVAIPNCVPPCDPVQCVDGDPCTTDECGADGQCVNLPIPGCGCGCASDADCDDGDPCTITACSNCECTAKLDPSCGGPDPVCNSKGVVDVSEAMWLTAGTAVKIAGAPEVWWDYGGCTKIGCDPGTCCNTCVGSLAVNDGTGTMPATELTDLGPAWQCTSDECGVTKSCAPPYHGVGYWMWGTTSNGKPVGNALVPAPQGWLDVDGWCLQTNDKGLPGTYTGELAFDSGEIVAATMTIALAADGSMEIGLAQDPPCTDCTPGIDTQIASNVTIGDGWISFTVVMNSWNGKQEVTFNLASWHNSLAGPFGPFVLGGPTPPIPVPVGPTGKATFTQDAPATK